MAVYTCPECRRRIRSTTDRQAVEAVEVFGKHNRNRYTTRVCPMSRQPIPGDLKPLTPLPRIPDDPTTQEQLSGVRAWWDNGVCVYPCGEPIMWDQRIIRHGQGWAHVKCYQEAHE